VYDAIGNAMLSKANVYRFEKIDFDFEECGSSEQEAVG